MDTAFQQCVICEEEGDCIDGVCLVCSLENPDNNALAKTLNWNISDIRIAKSGLTDNVYAGMISSDGTTWLQKKDVTTDFITAVLHRWAGFSQTINASDGKSYRITVKKIDR